MYLSASRGIKKPLTLVVVGISIGIFVSWLFFLFRLRQVRDQFRPSMSPAKEQPGFPYPDNHRQYHRCLYESIPYVSGVLETAQYLLSHPSASLVRFGDGEVCLMQGKTLRFQHANASLASALFRAMTEEIPNLMVGLPDLFSGYPPTRKPETDYWYSQDQFRQWFMKYMSPNRQYLNAKITSIFTSIPQRCGLLNLTYSTLRTIWKNQDIILLRGNNTQIYDYDVYDTARSVKVIYAPRYHAWSAYSALKDQLFTEDPSKLFILTAGPVAKILTVDLARTGRRVLDLGHLAKDYDAFMGNKSTAYLYRD